MQILAHPDDDLYFMNPDARLLLDAGVPLVCVYVTAGEHDGRNHVPGTTEATPDKAAYSSARHQGLRQAYAELLGLDRFTPWQQGVATLRRDLRAEINTLANGARRVELIHLNLAMHTARGNRPGLPSLWHDRALALPTVVATGAPVRRAGSYDYDELVDVLVGLMERYRPTVVHTLDPDPDLQFSDERTRRKDSEQRGYSDHADHTAVACFGWAAMIAWVAEATRDGGEVPAFAATAFRGYYHRHWPKNLPEPVQREKAAPLLAYGGSPAWECGNAAGCGDYNVGQGRPLTNRKGWVRSTRHRHPGPRLVVTTEPAPGPERAEPQPEDAQRAEPQPEDAQRAGSGSAEPANAQPATTDPATARPGPDERPGPGGPHPGDRLAAYGVLGLRAVRWRETGAGSGRWGAPEDLGGGPLAPVLGATALPDGRQLLFGLRFAALSGHGGDNAREIVLLEQRSPGGPFLAWRGLGNPERGDDHGRRIGVPVAVTTHDGTVHLFVRNADKGVSTRVRRATGNWEGWRDLGGGEVQDGLTALVDADGRVHLFAAGHDTVHHWRQREAGGPVEHRPAGVLPGAVDAPAAVLAADGTVELLHREERPYRKAGPRDSRGSADLRLTRTALDGRPLPRIPFDGYGPVAAAVSGPGDPVLLGQDLSGRLMLRDGGTRSTRTAGAPALGAPTLYADGDAPAAVALGPDAHPWTWRPGAGTAG
ncbi:PIG-L family deacetylase [Streptomyces sp. NPDC005805]|uniref:PIG-L family deacetylase n=1 Tax=Streptomyces sp. NPDC005805 TaxID=3157068 RepID=UPI003411BEE7